MADIAAANVTYTITRQRRNTDALRRNLVTIAFGNGALTYPTGGVPLTAGKMGTPTEVQSLTFTDEANADGFLYKWDKANNKVRIYQGDNDAVADGPLIELVGGAATPAATSLIAEVVGW